MARSELVSATVLRPDSEQGVTIATVLAAIPAVVGVVLLWIGDAQLPEVLRGLTPWVVALALVLAAVTLGLWSRARRRLTLFDEDGQQVLEIDDRPPLRLTGPFTVRTGWTRMPGSKSTTVIVVQVALMDGDRAQLMLTESWGGLMTPPPWPEEMLSVAGVDAVYSSGGIRFLKRLVDALEVRQ